MNRTIHKTAVHDIRRIADNTTIPVRRAIYKTAIKNRRTKVINTINRTIKILKSTIINSTIISGNKTFRIHKTTIKYTTLSRNTDCTIETTSIHKNTICNGKIRINFRICITITCNASITIQESTIDNSRIRLKTLNTITGIKTAICYEKIRLRTVKGSNITGINKSTVSNSTIGIIKSNTATIKITIPDFTTGIFKT